MDIVICPTHVFYDGMVGQRGTKFQGPTVSGSIKRCYRLTTVAMTALNIQGWWAIKIGTGTGGWCASLSSVAASTLGGLKGQSSGSTSVCPLRMQRLSIW